MIGFWFAIFQFLGSFWNQAASQPISSAQVSSSTLALSNRSSMVNSKHVPGCEMQEPIPQLGPSVTSLIERLRWHILYASSPECRPKLPGIEDLYDGSILTLLENSKVSPRKDPNTHVYLEAAANSFALPKVYLACIFFRESKWDPKARGNDGDRDPPLGVSQTKKTARAEITGIIRGRSNGNDRAKWLLKSLWERFFHETQVVKPKIFGAVEALKAPESIVAGTLWLAYYLHLLKSEELPQEQEEIRSEREKTLNDLELVACAYSQGINALIAACTKSHGPPTYEKCKSNLNQDARNYGNAIRKCLINQESSLDKNM